MNYTLLGKTGVKVSTLCFGTMLFGGAADGNGQFGRTLAINICV